MRTGRRLSDDEFAELVRRYERKLYAVALSILRDVEEALDVVQDTFIRLHRSYRNIENPSKLGAWLVQTTRNLSIDRLRARKRKESISFSHLMERMDEEKMFELVPRDYLESLKEKKVLSRAVDVVMDAVSELAEHYREAFLLRYMSGMSVPEIADFLGLPVSTVEGRIFNARQSVRQRLEKLLQ